MKTPWRLLRGVIQEGAERRGVAPRRSGRGLLEPLLGAAEATERWVRPACLNTATGQASSDQMLLLTLYADLSVRLQQDLRESSSAGI